ncbi:unnamed protein product, partial [Linum tenue]
SSYKPRSLSELSLAVACEESGISSRILPQPLLTSVLNSIIVLHTCEIPPPTLFPASLEDINNLVPRILIRDPRLVKGSLLVDFELQKRQRVIVETIVGLLPTQYRKSPDPMSFLSGLLKTAIATSTANSYRSYLERRIRLQLDQTILEDFLIPTHAHGAITTTTAPRLQDTDSILRILVVAVVDRGEKGDDDGLGTADSK